MHAAHRRAHHQPQVIDLEPLSQQPIVGRRHVAVAVMGKTSVQSLARPARTSVTDAVRQNEMVPRSIEELPLAEELPGKFRTQKVAPLAGRPVHDEHRIANDPLAVACGRAQRAVVQAQLGQRFAGCEMKVANHKVAGLRGWVVGSARRRAAA